MKAVILSLALLLTLSSIAQNNLFNKKQTTLQLGVGFISTLTDKGDYGVGMSFPLKTPPISLALDHGVSDALSLGVYVATASNDVFYEDNAQKVKLGEMKHLIIGMRGLYHFDLTKKLDTYGGAMLGYNAMSVDGTIDDSKASQKGLTYTLLVGGKYYFNKGFGAFVELGYGVAAINLGLHVKL